MKTGFRPSLANCWNITNGFSFAVNIRSADVSYAQTDEVAFWGGAVDTDITVRYI